MGFPVTRTLLSVCVVSTIAIPAAPVLPADKPRSAAFAVNESLGRGINFGNALDAPNEGEWGFKLEADYFRAVKAAGFQTVRLPVRWSAHAAPDAPYAIAPPFFKRVDWALDQAEANKLNVVLNVHHYDELHREPKKHLPRLVGLWEQIAARYKDRPASVVFELCNEPNGAFDEAWNDAIPVVLKAVRATNPTRAVVVGPGSWNNISALPKLKLPDDPNLILTVHFYEPFKFTHQGAAWAPDDVKNLSGIKWSGDEAESKALGKSLDEAAEWAKKNNRPVFVGEFGAYEKADMASRARWTAAVVKAAEARGFSWAYWEFGSGFGAYDPAQKAWRGPLLAALQPK
jgi:endoglucanase